jgi:hypothetical protein
MELACIERRVEDFALRVRRDTLERGVTWFLANDVMLLDSQNYYVLCSK